MTKTPSALLINDIHVGKDNISEFLINWDEMLKVCYDYNIDTIIIGGDLWQSRSAQNLNTLIAVHQALLKATKQRNINIVIASGNHDKVNQESFLSYNHIFSGYPGIDVINDYGIYDIGDGVVLYVMSYFPENGTFADRLKKIVDDLEGDINILYCHEGIRGGLSVPSDDELPANIFSSFDKVLVGHYHNRKSVPDTNIEYIGSSRQHNFGEDEEKGYTILYSDGSTRFVKNKANMRYKVITMTLDEMTEESFKELQRIKAGGKYKVKVRINCDSTQAKTIDKQKLVESGATKIELVTEQTEIRLTESQDLSKKFDKSGIKTEYTQFCSERAIENIELGLQYLDKIN